MAEKSAKSKVESVAAEEENTLATRKRNLNFPSYLSDYTEQSAYISVGKPRRTVTGAGTSVTGLPVVPVKVRAKGSNTLLHTYAFLDGGSNTTFCSDQLLKDLGVRGIDTTLSLTTMERENSTKASSLIQLEVFDLDENNFIELPLVFSSPVLPISSESVPRQEDVDR